MLLKNKIMTFAQNKVKISLLFLFLIIGCERESMRFPSCDICNCLRNYSTILNWEDIYSDSITSLVGKTIVIKSKVYWHTEVGWIDKKPEITPAWFCRPNVFPIPPDQRLACGPFFATLGFSWEMSPITSKFWCLHGSFDPIEHPMTSLGRILLGDNERPIQRCRSPLANWSWANSAGR